MNLETQTFTMNLLKYYMGFYDHLYGKSLAFFPLVMLYKESIFMFVKTNSLPFCFSKLKNFYKVILNTYKKYNKYQINS
jgi:hypothetical protein